MQYKRQIECQKLCQQKYHCGDHTEYHGVKKNTHSVIMCNLLLWHAWFWLYVKSFTETLFGSSCCDLWFLRRCCAVSTATWRKHRTFAGQTVCPNTMFELLRGPAGWSRYVKMKYSRWSGPAYKIYKEWTVERFIIWNFKTWSPQTLKPMYLRPLTCQNRCTVNFLCLKVDAPWGHVLAKIDGHNLFPNRYGKPPRQIAWSLSLRYGPVIWSSWSFGPLEPWPNTGSREIVYRWI